MADIKKINVGGTDYNIADEYARKRIEGLSNVYTISAAVVTGGTFVDWDTEASVTVADANVKNSSFMSTATEVSITGTGAGDFYLVLESKKSGVNYAKQMTKMIVGDTIYVKEGLEVAFDRWLASVDVAEGSITAKFPALEGKIDLSDYAKKSQAAKAGYYTTDAAGDGSTEPAGEETATGSVSVTYDKVDSATGSAGGQTVNSAAAGAVSITYTPEGTISQPTFSDGLAASAGGHTHEVTVSGTITLAASEVKTAAGTVTYTPAGTVASHSHSIGSTKGTVNEITDAGTLPELTVTDTTVVVGGSTTTVLTGVKASGTTAVIASYDGATSKLVTDTISGVSGSTTASKATAGTAINYGTADVGTATTVATGITSTAQTVATSGIASVSASGTSAFNTDAYKVDTAELANGVLKLIAASTASAVTGITSTAATTASVIATVSAATTSITPAKAADTTRTFTPYTFADVTVPVAAAAKTFATGALSATGAGASVMTGLGTASTVSVVTGVAANGTTNAYTSLSTATIGSASGWSAGSLPTFAGKTVIVGVDANTGNTAPTFTGTGVRLEAAGGETSGEMTGTASTAGAHTHTVSGTVSTPTFTGTTATLTQAAHTHSVTLGDHAHSISTTSTAATGTCSVAISNHTHSIGSHNHGITLSTIPV